MKSAILAFVYNRKGNASKTKEATVELRITYERKQKYIATGIRLLPKHWKRGVVVNRMDAAEINRALEILMTNVRKVLNEMMERGCIDIHEIPAGLKRLGRERMTFLEYARERALVRQYGKSVDTGKRYERFLRFLEKWGGIVYFSDLTEGNVMKMDVLLSERGMKPYSKWNNYHRFLNSFILDAMGDGYMSRNPYKGIRIDKDKVSRGLEKHLTPEEFKRLESVRLPSVSLERVRDMFVFQTYTCLSYTDLRKFDASCIKVVDGRRVYTGHRAKTGQTFTFLLLRPALMLLDKYSGRLPVISNVKYNYYLKVVALAAGIDKPLSSHWARHTGATLLLNSGVDMEVVAKVLGHSSTRITRSVYAKLLDETVVRAMCDFEKGMGQEC